MANTAEQMESMLPSADNEYLPTPEKDFTASDFASDTWEQAKKRFMNAGIINTDPNDPKLLTAYNRSMDYLKDVGLSGLLATQAAYEFAVGSAADSVPFMSESNKGRLARDLAAMPEAFVGGGTRSLSQLDDLADLAAPTIKQTISKSVDFADRIHVSPSALGTIGGNFALRTPGETGNFKRAIDFFKKKGGTDPNNFKDINRKMYDKFGWYINPSDGQWRYQISDKNSKLDLKNFKVQIRNLDINKTKTLKLSDILTHDQLFKRYPHLKNINVEFENRLTNPTTGGIPALGSFYGGDNLIKINVNKDRGVDVSNLGNSASFKATLFHEIQHAIQEYEGFIPGASTSNIPIEVTKKHSNMLANNLDFSRNQRKKIFEEIEGSALEHKINTDTLLSDFLQDKYLKTGVVLFTSEDEVFKKFDDAVKKVGLPPNIFDVPPGSSKAFLDLSDDLNRLRNSFLDDVKTKTAIGYIEDRIYRGVRGELESTGVEVQLENAQKDLRYPLDVEQDIIKVRELEDFTDSLDETAQQALIEEDPGYRRRQTYRKVDPGVVDAKIDIDLSKFKYHLLDKMKPAKDLSDPEYLAFLKLKEKGISQAKIQDEKTKFLLDNIAKNNSQLKKIKNLKRGDTFSYTLPNGKTVKVKLAFVKTQKVKRSDLNKTDDTLVIKDTRPNKSNEEMSDFNIPYAYLEIISPTVNDPVLKKSIPDLIKNSNLVKDGKNFNILDLGDTRPEEGAFNKIKKLFGFAEGGDTVRPEPRPEAEIDVSPRAEAGDQFFVKQAEREKAFKTKPKPRPSMDKSFPNVKPKPRPGSEMRTDVVSEEYEIDGSLYDIPVLIFKSGEKIAFGKVLQNIVEKGGSEETNILAQEDDGTMPGIDNLADRVKKFIRQNNPTREEFETYWYNPRVNKGGLIGDQMQMAFMNEGGLTDDGMDVDPVSGNDIPSGSMAEEVRDDIPAQLSDGEYVVPADVVRYYGVKFFEDLRDQAKMGLARMEANGRIGGEPVPDGGPMNTQELSPEEMQAIQEIMGMSLGGSVEADMLDGQTSAQVEQGMLTRGSAAMNQNYTGIPLGSTIFDSPNTEVQTASLQGVQQTDAKAFTPIVLYNTAGQTRTVNSAKEKTKAIAEGYTMTLDEYNMYRSKRGGSGGAGGGSGIITPPGQEDKEKKPWGEGIDWNNEDSIRKFVKEAQEGNIEGASGRFLRGAGFALFGLPGALLAGAFQTFQAKQTLADMQTAQEIARANGFDDLAKEIEGDINSYLKTAGDAVNFINDVFGPSTSQADRWARTQGFDTLEDYAAAQEDKRSKTPVTKKTANIIASEKQASKGTSSGRAKAILKAKASGVSTETAKKLSGSQMKAGSDVGAGPGGSDITGPMNKGGLMTKGKKKK